MSEEPVVGKAEVSQAENNITMSMLLDAVKELTKEIRKFREDWEIKNKSGKF